MRDEEGGMVKKVCGAPHRRRAEGMIGWEIILSYTCVLHVDMNRQSQFCIERDAERRREE